MQKFKLVCFTLLSLVLLTSCSVFAQVPPSATVRQAIIQQQIDMQGAIAKDLGQTGLSPDFVIPDFKVGKVAIESREELSDPALRKQAMANGAYIDGLYKVVGTYESTLTQGEQPTAQTIEQQNPFEVYLGKRPKSMRSTVSAAEASEMWYLLSPNSAKPLP